MSDYRVDGRRGEPVRLTVGDESVNLSWRAAIEHARRTIIAASVSSGERAEKLAQDLCDGFWRES